MPFKERIEAFYGNADGMELCGSRCYLGSCNSFRCPDTAYCGGMGNGQDIHCR